MDLNFIINELAAKNTLYGIRFNQAMIPCSSCKGTGRFVKLREVECPYCKCSHEVEIENTICSACYGSKTVVGQDVILKVVPVQDYTGFKINFTDNTFQITLPKGNHSFHRDHLFLTEEEANLFVSSFM